MNKSFVDLILEDKEGLARAENALKKAQEQSKKDKIAAHAYADKFLEDGTGSAQDLYLIFLAGIEYALNKRGK